MEELKLPQDLPTAREVLRLETLNLREDLGLGEYEGVFSYYSCLDGIYKASILFIFCNWIWYRL